MANIKKTVQLSRKLSRKSKDAISPYLLSSSRYTKFGTILGLKEPTILLKISKMAKGVSFGADNSGFFVYTHRCRSKSYKKPELIPKKVIDFIESTG